MLSNITKAALGLYVACITPTLTHAAPSQGDLTGIHVRDTSKTQLAKSNLEYTWEHVSTAHGDFPTPNAGNQQTATLVMDVDQDGINDFIIAERSEAPAVVWYRRTATGWDRYVVDQERLPIEAGSAFYDIDGDGDLDIVFGGDSQSNQLWWWENPYPNYDPDKPWVRRLIKDGGAPKHHDQLFEDVDGDGKTELVFWNQGGTTLFLAKIPDDPKQTQPWNCVPIYQWSADSEMEQRGSYPGWRKTNEHEGLATIDIDGDGQPDIVGGGRWFKHIEGTTFRPNIIDAGYAFTRTAVGDFIEGGRPEVLLIAGDGTAPLVLYEWQRGVWKSKILIENVMDGHSITVLDLNGDGHLDVFLAEMQLGKNPDPKTRVLFGDGQGNFAEMRIHSGFGLHEGVMVDLNGDGLPDILGKPYNWKAPRVDIWINKGIKTSN
ncbi:FG-GAP repeat domain-containing protein [Parapedobacter soli]|uniref:FG-GAP repeat domain-containing protein n=1 Tax=Parapedobacter soli TaxID=416955 RepID=UPI0021C69841|nr:VCBS repeat-containing protein [Parapedobacter soli]